MLQRIRDSLQAKRWVAGTVLGALALVFAAWGAYGIVDLSIGTGNYAARVNGEKISAKDAQEGWQRRQQEYEQQFQNEIPAAMKTGLQEQFLEDLVRERLISEHSRDLGYRVSDDMVQQEIHRFPRFLGTDGKYSEQNARYALAQMGMTEEEFIAAIRGQMETSQITMGLRSSEFVTPTEKARLQKLASEQRELRYAVIKPDKFAAEAKIDDAAIDEYYKSHQASFMTAEYVQLAYGELRLDQLASQVQVSDEELQAEYEKTKGAYVQPEERHVRHILIEAAQDDAAAQKKAQEAYAEAKSAPDFGAVAKKLSQDAGSASQGGDLGWMRRDAPTDKAFLDAVFAMNAGEIRGPVKTESGYHIIQLVEVQPGKTKTLEEARPELEAQVRKAKAGESFGDVQEQLQQRIEQPNADFEAIAKEFQLTTGEVAQFERGKGGAPLGDSPELDEAVFSSAVLDEHRIGGPVALGEDRLVLVKALKHEKPAPKPLAAVRDEIVATLRKQAGDAGAAKAAEAARARLEIGTPFDQVAREAGVTAEPAHFVSRDDPSVPQGIREAVFRAPRPAAGKALYRTATLDTGGAAVVAVTAVRTEPNPDPNLLARQQQGVAQHTGVVDGEVYLTELRRTAKVSKNPKVFSE
jgi:peptidyl-prolyl cis-trans isomerase D